MGTFIAAILSPFIGPAFAGAIGGAVAGQIFGGNSATTGLGAAIGFFTGGLFGGDFLSAGVKQTLGITLLAGGAAYSIAEGGAEGFGHFAAGLAGGIAGAISGNAVAGEIQGFLADPATAEGGNTEAQKVEVYEKLSAGEYQENDLTRIFNDVKTGITEKVAVAEVVQETSTVGNIFKMRTIAGTGGGFILGGEVTTFQIQNTATGASTFYTFVGVGANAGYKLAGSFVSQWQYIYTKVPGLTTESFSGYTIVTWAGAKAGAGAGVLNIDWVTGAASGSSSAGLGFDSGAAAGATVNHGYMFKR